MESNPTVGSNFSSNGFGLSVNGRQPLFNRSNDATIAQAELSLESSLADLDTAEQDLMLRVSQAYFDVLGAQDTLQTTRANKAAISEQLASAKRNFEVGTATITDTREAQARFDLATAQEIAADFPSGVDALITGVGTGGHITGCAQVLKKMWPRLKVYAVEPAASPVISGGQPSPHPIQGIGAGFVPKNLHVDLLDGVILVEAEAAREMARRSAREEGLLVGVSSGATLAAIAQKLPDLPAGATVLGFNYDTGERYLSIEGFLPA